MKKIEFVILGGGVAGLSAAMRLTECGASPLVVEGGNYPAHKICGEFFSPSSIKILDRWEIQPVPVIKSQIHTPAYSFSYIFPECAGSLSHYVFDPSLAIKIQKNGAQLLTQTKIENIIPAANTCKYHLLELSTGEKLLAKHLIIATGKLACLGSTNKAIAYKAFKAHFSNIDLQSTLHMFSFPDAYLGISPIEEKKVNVACLIKLKNNPEENSFPLHPMNVFVKSHPLLKELIEQGKNLMDGWMETNVPEFGLRQTPSWPRTYFIGDAAATIPPACGNGLSLGIHGGCMAADYALQDNPEGFKKKSENQFLSQMQYAKWLHRLFLNPAYGNPVYKLANCFPSLADKMFALTRH